ncbi:MAG TPA: adenosylmethionine decarboxylase [Pararobbsia sp.]|nr:adenosylmethionine decarboxylase [Pararobbsia sp.]
MSVSDACGEHVIADLDDVDPVLLRDAQFLERIMLEAADEAGAQVLSSHFHHFGGEHGVTGVVMLAESHISMHTWPERRFAALDVFMCGNADASQAARYVCAALAVTKARVSSYRRGVEAAADHP